MRTITLISLLALTACGTKPGLFARKPAEPAPTATPTAIGPYAGIRIPARPGDTPQDVVAAQEEDDPTPPLAAKGPLGTTIASLGNAAEPGVWLKTPLTKTAGPGKVSYKGKTVTAQLIPIDGPATAGSRASLQLLRQLGAPITGLPELTVSR
jgi:hypothetical protein